MTVDELRKALAEIPGDVPVGVRVTSGDKRSKFYEDTSVGVERFLTLNAPPGIVWITAKSDMFGLELSVFDAAVSAVKAITLLEYKQTANEPVYPEDEKEYSDAITKLIVSVDEWRDGGGA